jgi:hypothetical protein
MSIEQLFANKPRITPISIKKFKIEGELADTVREIRKALGGSSTLQEVLLALIGEGAKAYKQWKAHQDEPAPVPQEQDPKA